MSRLGKKPVILPKEVSVSVEDRLLTVKGPLGDLSRLLSQGIVFSQSDGQLSVQVAPGGSDALQGCFRKLAENMILGVTQGFRCSLQIEGVGYRAQVVGDKLSLQLGFSKPFEYRAPPGIKITVDAKQTLISVEGNDKELVGRVAAQIRSIKPPEPYKGTGIRYQDEQIKKKPGKAAAGAVAAGGAKK